MDETRQTPWHRPLLVPAMILLAVPALAALVLFLTLRAMWFALLQLLRSILPWRRVETAVPKAIRPPHFVGISDLASEKPAASSSDRSVS